MTPEAAEFDEDLEQLRRRFEEFRSAQPGHQCLPEVLWTAALPARRIGRRAMPLKRASQELNQRTFWPFTPAT
jgi:hypothetical protein